MNPIMLGDFSARSMGMPLADYVYLQNDRPTRYRRRRRAARSAGRPAGAATPARPARRG